MVGPRAYSDPGEDRENQRKAQSPPRAPRWVKVAAVIGALVALIVVVMLLFGGGSHGPGRHTGDDTRPSSPAQSETAPSNGGGVHTPPAGGH
jgi:hypothetical protein